MAERDDQSPGESGTGEGKCCFPGQMEIIIKLKLSLFYYIIVTNYSNFLLWLEEFKWKYIYPIIISILFIPSVFIYYNSSALIHAVWYLVDSGIGFLIGLIIYKITNKK